jgi:hypothetical protein
MQHSPKATKIRLFLTCWLVFVVHFATDFAREHYLVLSIVDDLSFRLDKYVGLHNDIFVTPTHGAHHGANPGASMIAALPYALFKPIIERVANYTKAKEKPTEIATAIYDDDRPARVEFYKQVRARGLDIKFGLVGFVTMAFCMAPLSAASAVAMFNALNYLGLSNGVSLGMSFLYGFGTPVFFRTGYLNQNLMVGIFGFIAFILLWQLGDFSRRNIRRRFAAAGFLGGLAFLCDYSGGIVLLMLGGYGFLRRMDSVSLRDSISDSLRYVAGALGPLILLWFYQWRSFGHPLYPPQHFMPPQIYSDTGYQGVFWPSGELLWMLLFNFQFGLFITAPVLLLAFLAPILSCFKKNIVPLRETLFILIFFSVFTLFFSTVQYSRLQWITGIRYLVPVIPFLFLLVVAVLIRMPRFVAYGFAVLAIVESWAMSMVRRVDVPGEGVLVSVVSFFFQGFQLPWLSTLGKMATQYAPFLQERNISPYPFLLLWAVIIYGIWRLKFPWESLGENSERT